MWPTHYIPNQPRLEGVPPPRMMLTSPPYPYEMLEEFQAAGGRVVSVTPGIGADEEISASGSFVGGTITTYGFKSYDWQEDLEVVASFIGGELVERLIRYTSPPDYMASSGQFVSGVMTDPLVRYENWPLGYDTEDLYAVGSFVSGALT